jgi:hypothetical protein
MFTAANASRPTGPVLSVHCSPTDFCGFLCAIWHPPPSTTFILRPTYNHKKMIPAFKVQIRNKDNTSGSDNRQAIHLSPRKETRHTYGAPEKNNILGSY